MFDGLDSTVRPIYVAPTDVFRWAGKIAPALLRMAEGSGGRYLAPDIAASLCAGRMQLWLALDGTDIGCVLVTEIVEYPRLRAMRCVGMVGHRPRRWWHLLHELENAARSAFGCQKMEAFVPSGLERMLVTDDWQIFHTLWEKPL